MWKAFRGVTEYATLPGHHNEFENATELLCKIIGFGNTEAGYNGAKEGFVTSVLVKYGPSACVNPE